MVITTDAKNFIRDEIQAKIDEMKFGTDDSSPSSSDSDLGNNVSDTECSDITKNQGNKTIITTGVLLSTRGTDETYNEAGLFFEDGTLFDRIVFPDYEHNGSQELHITFVNRID